MKIKDLVALLLQLDQEKMICIFDIKGNLLADDGEGASAGIYPDFAVEKITKEDVPDGSPEWVALTFSSDFIDDAVFEGASERKCRVCGCTDGDCRQCIEKTGQPCSWVEEDLCSACVTAEL